MSSVYNQPGWHELMTSDLEGAKTFYNKLFGWTTMEIKDEKIPGGIYNMFKDSKGPHSGVLVPPAGGPKPQWVPYFCVRDPKDIHDKAVAAGATVMMPVMDIGAGTLAMYSDPLGAIFATWKSAKEMPGDMRFHVSWNWDLLRTDSTSESWKFYSKVFDNWHKLPFFNIFHFQDSKVWGGMFAPKETPCDNGKVEADKSANAPTKAELKAMNDENYWLPHIAVDDVDAIIVKAKSLGCKILVEPCDIPDVEGLPTSGSRLAGFMDPQGARVAIMNLKIRDVKPRAASSDCCMSSKLKLNGSTESCCPTSSCPSDCTDKCCTKTAAQECPADCTDSCCAPTQKQQQQQCPADCKDKCCTSACPPDCSDSCCANSQKCPADCTDKCCAKESSESKSNSSDAKKSKAAPSQQKAKQNGHVARRGPDLDATSAASEEAVSTKRQKTNR